MNKEIKNGVAVIKQSLKTMTDNSGIYRMLDEGDNVLYVGKAKNLKKRIINYTHIDKLTTRIARMVMQVSKVEITTTRTEAEALLLEANLIKNLKPRYNILLKDDKSFPYIVINEEHDFPQITKHRGKKKKNATYFGPFAAASDVNAAISILQKAFLLRPCSNSVFNSATRPCMEYQIKRCSAPCVNKISKNEYGQLVKQTKLFLEGKTVEIQKQLTGLMEQASADMDYEKAVIYRDRIKALASIQAKQSINSKTIIDGDVLAITSQEDKICVEVFFIRAGQTLGNKAYFPYQTEGHCLEEILEAFIARFYQTSQPPKQIILSHDVFGKKILQEALSQLVGHKVNISAPTKGEKRKMVDIALTNAKSALNRKIQEDSNEIALLTATAKLFNIKEPIKRIEVFDNSHIFGKHAVGGMIVSGEEGFIKNAYRKFNVDSGNKKTGGDDYYMMQQVLKRRYSKLTSDNHPDLILIDGGAGHLQVAKQVFDELKLDIAFICIAKGPDRNAGREDYYTIDKPPFKLPKDDSVGYFMQRLRDEAHRFAISTHRAKRQKNTIKSALDDIAGIGATRKRALLNHFGSVNNISQARLQELLKVENINKKTAQVIFDYFN